MWVYNPFTGNLDWTSAGVSAPLSLISTSPPQLIVGYNNSNKTSFGSGSNGRLTLDSIGSDPALWLTFNGDIRTKINTGGISLLYEYAAIDITTFGVANAGVKYGWNGGVGIGDGGVTGQLALMAGSAVDVVKITTAKMDSTVPGKDGLYTFGTLPSAASFPGFKTVITDSTSSPVYGGAATGGGSTYVEVLSDGVQWNNA